MKDVDIRIVGFQWHFWHGVTITSKNNIKRSISAGGQVQCSCQFSRDCAYPSSPFRPFRPIVPYRFGDPEGLISSPGAGSFGTD